MIYTNFAQIELDKLKQSVIGICKQNNIFYLIMDYNDIPNEPITMNGIRITQFGAVQQFYGMPLKGQYQAFPNNQTMSELLEKPHEWLTFINSFFVESN